MSDEPIGNRPTAPRATASDRGWFCAGALLVAFHTALLLLSPRFSVENPILQRPIVMLAVLDVLAGLVWLKAVWPPPVQRACGRSLLYMIAVGIALRGLMLFSTPMLEDDFWRYLWDGAVVAHGQSPYARTPQAFLDAAGNPGDAFPEFQPLAGEGLPVLTHINHPTLRTIYPPLAQAAFAVAHCLAPWSLGVWRVVLLLFDAATLALLLLLLRRLQLPALWAAAYWWSPLLVRETVNAAHMDVLALPLVLGGILLADRGRLLGGVALVSLAAGMKVWPVILLPFLLRPLLGKPHRLLWALALAAAILALISWPAVGYFSEPASGLAAYAERWEMNDALFMALLWSFRAAFGWFGESGLAPAAARVTALLLLGAWVAWRARRPPANTADMVGRMLWAVAGLFLLSPTQFPWYGLWILPLLAARPRLSLFVLLVLLPLYRLRFHFDARDSVRIFDCGVVWLEFIPVWGLLLWEAMKEKSMTRCPPGTPVTRGERLA